MDEEMMKKLMTLIFSRLKYATTVWSPHKKKYKAGILSNSVVPAQRKLYKFGRIQRAVITIVPQLGRFNMQRETGKAEIADSRRKSDRQYECNILAMKKDSKSLETFCLYIRKINLE